MNRSTETNGMEHFKTYYNVFVTFLAVDLLVADLLEHPYPECKGGGGPLGPTLEERRTTTKTRWGWPSGSSKNTPLGGGPALGGPLGPPLIGGGPPRPRPRGLPLGSPGGGPGGGGML